MGLCELEKRGDSDKGQGRVSIGHLSGDIYASPYFSAPLISLFYLLNIRGLSTLAPIVPYRESRRYGFPSSTIQPTLLEHIVILLR